MMYKTIYYPPLVELISFEGNDVITTSGSAQFGEVFNTSGYGNNVWE